MRSRLPSTFRPLRLLLPALLATAAQADIVITADKAEVTSGETCTLSASHAEGTPGRFRWRLEGFPEPNPLLETLDAQRARFRAPTTFVVHGYTLVAEDLDHKGASAAYVLHARPDRKSGAAFQLLEAFADAMTPSLRLFKGDPGRIQGWASIHAPVTSQIAFCDDPAMGPLDRCWLVAGAEGLRAFRVTGAEVPLPGELGRGGRMRTLVAALPPGTDKVPVGAPRVVILRQGTFNLTIWALEPDGRVRPLLEGAQVIHGLDQDGAGAAATFTTALEALALDRQGNTYVLESSPTNCIRKIDPGGKVTTLPFKTQHKCLAMTLDPASGCLFVGCRDQVYQVTPEGAGTLILGGTDQDPQALLLDGGVAPLGPGRIPRRTCYSFDPLSLAIHGRELLLATPYGFDAFHLDTRRLVRVIPFHGFGQARLGPVPFLNPHLAPDACAVLRNCGPLALTKEAMGLVDVNGCLCELELPDDPLTTIMDFRYGASAEPPGSMETKATAPPAKAPDELWPGWPSETLAVPAAGQCGLYFQRTITPNQTFSGSCRVQAKGLAAGRVEVNLVFLDGDGIALGSGHAVAAGRPNRAQAPLPGPAQLQVTGTAPDDAARVVFYVQVEEADPGAEVTFQDVTFRLARP